ncbi:Ig-like domain-containing protein, partial [Bifidobacterium thermophilum]|uniref:Ig-like domain-containing protein n=1 Tax=Bifidobacterium thermophilum TaxID=33905 RepID=UPI0030D979EF
MRTGRYSADAGEGNHSSPKSSTITRHGMFRKLAAGVLAVATMFGGMALGSTTASAATSNRDSYTDTLGNADFEAARTKYGLTKDMKNGAILHAWMWSFNTIKNNMKAIAEAGYTSVQTEPMSAIKTNPANGKKFTENWYYVYQPTDTTIGNFVVGTEQDLKDMCAEAHKYGVRIIVDVVANHFTSDWNAIGGDWKDTSLFHSRTNCPGTAGDQINYSDRWQVTHCHLLGLWDINTENQTAANKMKDFLVEAVNDGVDGFRFDAAKHVELPDEFSQHSVYWETILKNGAQYQYGEVLQGDSSLSYTGYTNMFTQYSSDGGGATASDYGKTVRAAIKSSSLSASNLSSLRNGGAKDDQLVTWVESHDNYANGDKESTGLTDYQLRMGWAIVGSRAGGAPLYFNRPVGSGGNNAQFAEQSQLGDAGDNMWKDKAVVAVNHFRNKMNGNSEYLRNCQSQNSCLMIERYAKDGKADDDGVVIANMGGDVNLAGSDTTLDDGTYTDQVNGGTITVSGGKITAGTAKGGAVSAFYDANAEVGTVETVTASPESKSFSTDTMTVTLHTRNASGATYTTSEGQSGSFKDGDTIEVGGSSKIGDSITVTVKAKGSTTGKELTNTYTYSKVATPVQNLASYYSTNKAGYGGKKTITVDGDVSDWDSSMIVAQGTANDDPRVYRPNSMYEVPIDLYTLYAAYDDNNVYLMWEMTNVQDVVAPNDNYPLSQGTLYENMNVPFFIAFSTGQSDTIGKSAQLTTGGTLWASGLTWQEKLNRIIAISTNGANGPFVYSGDSTGLNANAIYGPKANAKTNTLASGIKFKWGKGILSKNVYGIDGAYGTNNGRVVGDMTNENAKWVDFNTKGHNSSTMDFHYEMSIPLSELGTDAASVAKSGLGVQVVATMGKSGMDSLPYDLTENDNADKDDSAGSQENNSFEKSDEDNFTVPFARIGAKDSGSTGGSGSGGSTTVPVSSVAISGDGVSGGALSLEKGKSAQLSASVSPSNATSKTVTWSSSDASVASVTGTGYVTAVKAGTATITATAGGKSASITVTVTDSGSGGGSQGGGTTTSSNYLYVKKPSGWNSVYAYIYNGDGSSAASNAKWPGEAMTAMTTADSCASAGTYRIEIPDLGTGTYRVIFSDNGSNSNRYPADMAPGLEFTRGTAAQWDGSSTTLSAVTCKTPDVPVSSVAVSGSGVSNGALSLVKGKSAQLTATVNPSNATNKTVTWSSSNA